MKIVYHLKNALHSYFYLILSFGFVFCGSVLTRLLCPHEYVFKKFISLKIFILMFIYYFLIKNLLRKIPFRNILLILILPFLVLAYDYVNFGHLSWFTKPTLERITIVELIDSSILSLFLLFCIDLFSSLNARFCRIFLALVQWLILLGIAIVLWIWFSGLVLDFPTLMAIKDTNLSEAFAYCRQNRYSEILPLLWFFSIVPVYIFLAKVEKSAISKRAKFFLCFCIFSSAIMVFHAFTEKHFLAMFTIEIERDHQFRTFAAQLKKQNQILHANQYSPKIRPIPNMAIIIGESHSRRFMTPENSPFFEEIKKTNRSIVIKKSFSCYTHTLPTLFRALTNQNQYVQAKQVFGLPALLTCAGYHSYWISNQAQYADGGVMAAISAPCKKEFYSEKRTYGLFPPQLDDCLLKYIPQKLEKPSVVFLHMFGCHLPYLYDRRFQKIGKNAYEKSLRTTDYFLQTAVAQLENAGCDIIVYCSDHGEVPIPGVGHDVRLAQPSMIEIPCWIYFSKKYAQDNPELVSKVSCIRDKIFTNDLLWNLVGGILEFEGMDFPQELNPFSPNYKIKTLQDAKTLLGKTSVLDLLNKEKKK